MLRVGITGQNGFIGSHLFNFLKLQEGIVRIPFGRDFFQKPELLRNFVGQCDVIVHLSAMNRHSDPQVIYDTNINLIKLLLEAVESRQVQPHIIFSSSVQEEKENYYGRSKRDGRNLLIEWAQRNNAPFTGLIIPNVFGPFGKPFYNSVVATFCHQLTHNENPHIDADGKLKLIYAGELVNEIWKVITERIFNPEMTVEATSEIKVSEILSMLKVYKDQYFDHHILPEIHNRFELNLFNTFRSFIELSDHYPVMLKMNTDERGSFVESVKTLTGGQFSFSTTKPGVTRGNHFHTRKIERFIVIQGKALIQLRKIGTTDVINFHLDGRNPSFVDMPVWYSHNIANTGSEDLLTLFWINEFYDPEDPDTFFEKV